MFIGYQQVVADASVKDSTALNQTYLKKCDYAMLQAETNDIRYTMDGTAPTETSGMLLKAGLCPEIFLSENLWRIKFIRTGASGKLNIHFSAGREIV